MTGSDAIPDNLDELCALIERNPHEPQDKRIRAVSKLGDLMDQAVELRGLSCLIDLVRFDKDVQIVNHCINVLSRINAQSSVSVLIDVVLATHVAIYEHPEAPHFIESDDSLRLRSTAAKALGRLGDGRAIVPLMSVLNDKQNNYRLRLAAAESLGKLGDDHAVVPLLEILKDEREKSVYLKESVVKALGMLGDIRAVEPLIDELESKRGIRDKFNFLKEQIIEAIARIGEPDRKATDSLIYALQDDAPSIRLAAVEALGSVGDPGCINELTARVFDKDDEVAKAAIYSVYLIGGEESLVELLASDNLPKFLRDELQDYISE